ncbi:murein biosynthesis integral membrane protein MurJ [Actinomadura rupiterrae]|uniref:murein biosynthesis integral membrane protein MurJ n=1 Tax=Actinomadura rupiterrae TaxID=559627 RepID=UPI0020A2F72D|nr:murein biosynthesis integral membrane protein MurJ [Actinomadura rupiterrae]MCP2343250.1 putative peptidoglycan lipid II flippase [Actinomadura rupiterrae]
MSEMLRTGRAMAVATVVSRITGFVRSLVLIAALGLGTRLMDAYTAANVTPNTIYELVMGGALASVIVPLLVRQASRPEADLFAQRLLSLVVYGLGAVVIVTVVAAPLIVDATVSGFKPSQRHLAVLFTRFFMPQILFYGVSATLAAVLNARGRLTTPLWAPVANNLVVIGTGLAFVLVGGTGGATSLSTAQTLLLSIGTSAGVAAQMAVLAVAGRRAGFRFRLHADPRGIGVRRIAAMAAWTLASVAAAQAVFVVSTNLASHAGQGMLSVFTNASMVFQLPYAVIAVTVMTSVLPRMSRAAGRSDLAGVTADLSRSLRLTGVALAPVAAALIVLGPALTTLMFRHGGTSLEAARLAGQTLAVYGFALVPFAGYQIMLRTFYALGDTRTPALVSVGVSAATAASALVAAQVIGGARLVFALAGCTGLAYAGGLVAAALLLRNRLGRVDGHRLLDTHLRTLAAATAAGLAAAAVARAVDAPFGAGPSSAAVVIVAASAAGGLLYALAARILGVAEVRTLTSALRLG